MEKISNSKKKLKTLLEKIIYYDTIIIKVFKEFNTSNKLDGFLKAQGYKKISDSSLAYQLIIFTKSKNDIFMNRYQRDWFDYKKAPVILI